MKTSVSPSVSVLNCVLFAGKPLKEKMKENLPAVPTSWARFPNKAAIIKPLGFFLGGVTGSRRGGDGWKEAISSVNRTKDSYNIKLWTQGRGVYTDLVPLSPEITLYLNLSENTEAQQVDQQIWDFYSNLT